MLIDYSVQRTFDETLVLEDAGNCAILCHGEFRDGKVPVPGDFYMIIKTIMGITTLVKWGPIMPGLPELPGSFSLEIKRMNYKELAIKKDITQFINDPAKGITAAEVIDEDKAFEALPKDYNYAATLS